MLEVHAGQGSKNKCIKSFKAKKSILYRQKRINSISEKKGKRLFTKGLNFFKEENYEAAIREFTKASIIGPKYFQNFYYRARSHMKIQNYSKAVKDFTRAFKLGDNNHLTYFFRGVAYENLGNLEKALADYTKAIEIKPDIFDTSIHSRRAEVYRKMQKPELAQKDREHILLQESSIHE